MVPLPLTGMGADHPPTADIAKRSPGDTHYFTSSVWLMATGSYQVRVEVDGAQGSGRLAVPVPAAASMVKKMTPGLGAGLLAMTVLLAGGFVTIVGAAAREGSLAPGVTPGPERRKAARIAMARDGVDLGDAAVFRFSLVGFG